MKKIKRKYNSEKRTVKALDTRIKILSASRKLFALNGVNKTTIDQIAKEAGVAAPTIYSLFGSKSGIVTHVGETFVFGEKYKSLVEKSISQKDPIESLKLAAAITIAIFEMEIDQMVFLWDEKSICPEVYELMSKLENQRYERQKFILERLESLGHLPIGMNQSTAREILWALTGRELFKKFVKEKGWSHTSYRKWLETTLISVLVRH